MLAFLLFVFFLSTIGYYVYMKIQFINLQKVLEHKQQILQNKKDEYAWLIDNTSYKKYQAAKVLYEDDAFIDWKETIIYLIDMFNKIRTVDKNVSWVTLDNFQISIDWKVRLTWIVKDIHSIYINGWLLDQFLDFNFIEELHVPYYQKYEGAFEFILDAIIKSHDGTAK